MKKPSKKLLVVVASTGIFASSLGTYTFKPMADEFVYSDANVSITSIVDRYIEENGNVFTVEEPEETTEAIATISDAVATTGEVEEVITNSGDVEAVEADAQEETTEETSEELEQETQAVADAPAVSASFDFTGKAVVKASGSVNIRQSGDVNAQKVGTIPSGGIMTVVEQGDTWSHITSGNVDGYIKNEFVAFGSDAAAYAQSNLAEVAVVNTAALKLRSEASVDSESITLLAQGESYAILSKGDAWTQIQVDNTPGYVKNEYIMISYNMPNAVAESAPAPEATQTTEAAPTPETTQAPETTTEEATTEAVITPPASGAGQDVANFAVQFVGNPYVWGGTSLTNGADCSGFVQSVYKEFGYSLPRTCTPQSKAGTPVSLSALAPGDLVFYDHGTGSCEHVAIYIGNGQVVHASSRRTGIKISNLNYSTPFKACRIIN